VVQANKTIDERLADMRLDILRDLGMLLMVAQILWAKGTERLIAELEVFRDPRGPA
jgi:hypothetical protein